MSMLYNELFFVIHEESSIYDVTYILTPYFRKGLFNTVVKYLVPFRAWRHLCMIPYTFSQNYLAFPPYSGFCYKNLDIKKTGWHLEQTLAKKLNPFLASFSSFKKCDWKVLNWNILMTKHVQTRSQIYFISIISGYNTIKLVLKYYKINLVIL